MGFTGNSAVAGVRCWGAKDFSPLQEYWSPCQPSDNGRFLS